MNYRAVLNLTGKVLLIEAALMLPSLMVALYYGEGDAWSFFLTIIILVVFAAPLAALRTGGERVFAREGFVIVAASWLLLSVFGALPFYLSGAIPSFVDGIFESISGFTTTGASILREIEGLPRGILFWRSFTHWVGGMGILVFTIALLPSIGGKSFHMLRAESPGPSTGKLVPKIADTAKILYIIYIAMTLLEIILLFVSGMPLYDSVVHAFGTAGTGGFSIKNASIAAYNSVAVDVIITVFMLLFGINFTVYFQLITGNLKSVFKNSELKFYLGLALFSVITITMNIAHMFDSVWMALRQAAFHVSSIMTTTGYTIGNFDLWPSYSKFLLVFLMLIGASAGSTGGGIKCIRAVILLKAAWGELIKIIHPSAVSTVKADGKTLDKTMVSSVALFFFLYLSVLIAAVALVSLDNLGIETTLTAVTATLGNIGPGLSLVGPAGNYAVFSPFSKIVLSFCMLVGRLEIYPMLLIFLPATWKSQ